MIVDSGKRREFGTGSVRDIAEGKGRCDLLPLGIIGEWLDDSILKYIELYIRTGFVFHLKESIDLFVDEHYDNQHTALLELAIHYEEGAKKYADRNWELGQPLHCYIDSGVRHYLKFMRGDTDERHDRAFLWNMFGAIWTQRNLPEMIDLPFKEVEKCKELIF